MLCLHCGNIYSFKRQGYCEDCYQKLIAENLTLQTRIKELKEQLQKEHEPKHMKIDTKRMFRGEEIDKHIPIIEPYFREKGE